MFPLKHQRQNLLLKRIPSTKIMLNRILTAKQLLLFFKEFLTVYNSTAYQLCPLQKTVSKFSFLVLLISNYRQWSPSTPSSAAGPTPSRPRYHT